MTRYMTTCSDCRIDLIIDAATLLVRVARSTAPAVEATDDDGLICWDCPACGHGDSLEVDA